MKRFLRRASSEHQSLTPGQVCDCLYHIIFFRSWIVGVKGDDTLITAAASDPTVILPNTTYEYMVAKGIFVPQGQDSAIKWLERLLGKLKETYFKNLKHLSELCEDWDSSTIQFIRDKVPTLIVEVPDMR